MVVLAGLLTSLAVALLFWPKISSVLDRNRRRRYTWTKQEETRLSKFLASIGEEEMDKLCRRAGRPRDLTGRQAITLQWTLGASLAVLGYAYGGLFYALIGGVGGWYLVRIWLSSQADDRIKRIELELPSFLDLWGLLISSGESIHGALHEIVKQHPYWVTSVEMQNVLDKVAASGLLGESLVEVARETGCEDLIAAAEQIRQMAGGGGSPSKELARIAERMRQERMAKLNQSAAVSATFGIIPKVFSLFLSLTPAIATLILGVMKQL